MKIRRHNILAAHTLGSIYAFYSLRPGEGVPYGATFDVSLMAPRARRAFIRAYIAAVQHGRDWR